MYMSNCDQLFTAEITPNFDVSVFQLMRDIRESIEIPSFLNIVVIPGLDALNEQQDFAHIFMYSKIPQDEVEKTVASMDWFKGELLELFGDKIHNGVRLSQSDFLGN